MPKYKSCYIYLGDENISSFHLLFYFVSIFFYIQVGSLVAKLCHVWILQSHGL